MPRHISSLAGSLLTLVVEVVEEEEEEEAGIQCPRDAHFTSRVWEDCTRGVGSRNRLCPPGGARSGVVAAAGRAAVETVSVSMAQGQTQLQGPAVGLLGPSCLLLLGPKRILL